MEIDSRSSDAIAVAVRAQVPIYAADDVIEESAIEMEGDDVNEEEIVDEFKRFLEGVTPEDFVEAESAELELEPEPEPDDEDDDAASRRRRACRARARRTSSARSTSGPARSRATPDRAAPTGCRGSRSRP